MKKIIQFFIMVTMFVISAHTSVLAREVSGSLSAGEGSSFIPSQGSAFSIIKDVTSGVYGGDYNILIKSRGRVIYEESHQIDDLYLVFNEAVDEGDIIKLNVNEGIFIFKMSHMSTLPDVVVDAIKEQKPKQYKQMEKLYKPRKKTIKKPVVEPVIEPIITPVVEPVVEAVSKPIVSPVVEPILAPTIKPEPIVYPTAKPEVTPNSEYDSRVIKRHIKPEDYKKAIASTRVKEPVVPKVEPKKEPLKPKALDSSITKSGIDKIAKSSKVTPPKTSASGITELPFAKTFPMVLDSQKSPVGPKSSIVDAKSKIESLKTSKPPVMKEAKTGVFKTQIATESVKVPKFQAQKPEVIVKKIELDEKIVKPPVISKEISKASSVPEIVPYKEPEVITPPVVQERIIEPVPEPKVAQKPIVYDDKPKDRIVITKTLITDKKVIQKDEPRVIKRHVKPKDYQIENEVIPERMSDRVLGNGYGLATPGRVKVKAYSNNRPVSAWVEVFKADTKQRVKTFYTGKGRALKDVKLPAGVYIIKATYRTATSKRKKTLGRITLNEGESINKSIRFDDGSIKVKVTKAGNPIYAKVEVFKAGKKRRIAYEFTSRSKGIANFSLGSGEYDIVVRDHGDKRRFDYVSVKGGKSKTLNADF